MKITAMEQSKSVSDVLCDICGDSTRVEGQGLQFGTLRASWGYGSAHDGERYEVHLCESCFFRTLLGLRRERMVNFMFSDEDQDLSDFGCVAHDDFFNGGTGFRTLLNDLGLERFAVGTALRGHGKSA